MEDTESGPPWPDMVVEFELNSARIVATLGGDRGAIVENVPKLLCWEGRLFSIERREDGNLNTLEYRFGFSESEDADPMASEATMGRIVITGRHANGLELEIRGDGWIGYDDKGNVEGTFDSPPILIAEDDDPEEVPDESSRQFPDFPMPPQFNKARLQVNPSFRRWSDEDY